MADHALTRGDALIIVDVQNDFCPGGLLPVPKGNHVIPQINAWIRRAGDAGIAIAASRDWHPKHHVSFAGCRQTHPLWKSPTNWWNTAVSAA